MSAKLVAGPIPAQLAKTFNRLEGWVLQDEEYIFYPPATLATHVSRPIGLEAPKNGSALIADPFAAETAQLLIVALDRGEALIGDQLPPRICELTRRPDVPMFVFFHQA